MPTTAKTYWELMQWGPNGWLDEMIFATGLTLVVALTGFLFGLIFGGISAAARMSRYPILAGASITYTTVLRGVPDGPHIIDAAVIRSVEARAIDEMATELQEMYSHPAKLIYKGEEVRKAIMGLPPDQVTADLNAATDYV